MIIAKRYQDELARIKQNIEKSYEYFKPNYDRYHEFRRFTFESALTESDIALLKNLGKPQIEVNTVEAFISRLRGEFSKQEPSITVEAAEGAPADSGMIALVEGHIRSILADANKDSFEYNIYTDLLSGGFSVIKVRTDYANEMSFDQKIIWERAFDPTMCGFDITAKLPHKADGQYAFENYVKTVDEFKDEFGNGFNLDRIKFSKEIGGFNWSYRVKDDDILLLSDYYEKKQKDVKIVQLVNGQVMTVDDYEKFIEKWRNFGILTQPPGVKGKPRTTLFTTICRYRCIENQVIDYKETDYGYLPLIFADGNSILLRDSTNGAVRQFTRPYIYHAKGQQRLLNFAVQTLANELENMVQHKWVVAKEAIPPEYAGAYTNNQIPNVVIHNAYKNDDPDKPLPPPREVVRAPAPPEITQAITMGTQMMQTILGSYDASLGINDNQLSGVAIVEGATQSNATAMPFVVGFLQALNQAAVVTLDLLPKYYNTPRTIPFVRPDGKRGYIPINQPGGINLNYQSNALNVRVEAGVNFAIQKSRALQQIIALCQASPLFAQFINQMGLEVLLDNLEIRGIDQLKMLAQKFMQQLQKMQQAQANQPNPMAMKTQLEQQKFQHQVQQDNMENQFRTAEIINDANANTNDRMKVILEQHQNGVNDAVQIKKADAETYKTAAELALKAHDQLHRHAKESAELENNSIGLAHQIKQSNQQPTGETQNG
jgi:hypothetical protein